MKIIVVGAIAGGSTVASQIRRAVPNLKSHSLDVTRNWLRNMWNALCHWRLN